MKNKYTEKDIPSDLSERLGAMIDRMEAHERHIRHRHLGIAASVIILLATGFTWTFVAQPEQQPKFTELTPDQAAKETERALGIFAMAIEQGQKKAVEATKVTQETTNQAIQSINNYSK